MRSKRAEKNVLNVNDRMAAALRESFEQYGVVCVQVTGRPGSGKTSLLEKTLERFSPPETRVAVLAAHVLDASRLARFGYPVNRMGADDGGPVDAPLIEQALSRWRLDELDLLLIETPGAAKPEAESDLGQCASVVVVGADEGGEGLVAAARARPQLLIVNKTDLAVGPQFDLSKALREVRRITSAEVLSLSCRTGEGLDQWERWLEGQMSRRREQGIAAAY